jgi:hypothetical protein
VSNSKDPGLVKCTSESNTANYPEHDRFDFYPFLYGDEIGSLHIDVDVGSWTTDVLVLEGQQQTSLESTSMESILCRFQIVFLGRFKLSLELFLLETIIMKLTSMLLVLLKKTACTNPSEVTFNHITFESLSSQLA